MLVTPLVARTGYPKAASHGREDLFYPLLERVPSSTVWGVNLMPVRACGWDLHIVVGEEAEMPSRKWMELIYNP